MDSFRPSDFYTGLVAEMYATLRSVTFDPAPYERFVRRSGQPALELGCGDGDPILDLISRGLEVEGLDSSGDMLARCGLAAAARGLDVVLHEQSMEAMDLGREYRSIYLAGATFNLITTDAGASVALSRIAAHLDPDGAALIPLMIPEPSPPAQIGATRTLRTDDGTELRHTIVSEQFDAEQRDRITILRYERLVDGHVVETTERPWHLHWHTQTGFRAMAEVAGLEVLAILDEHAAPATEDALGFSFILRLAQQSRL